MFEHAVTKPREIVPKMPSITVVGEVMLEFSSDPKSRFILGVAGDTYNTAIALSHLGVSCEYLTALGEDSYSHRIRAALKSHGIEDRNIAVDDQARPGLYIIETDVCGERIFSYWRDTSAARRWLTDAQRFKHAMTATEGKGAIYWSGITLALMSPEVRSWMFRFLVKYRQANGKVYFDSNFRPALWREQAEALRAAYAQAIDEADVYLPSLEDECAIWGLNTESEVVSRLRKHCVGDTVLTTDAQAIWLNPAQIKHFCLPRSSAVIDTTGAGDAFSGGVLAAIIRGASFEEAIGFAHQLAAQVVNVPGAILPYEQWQKHADALDEMLP